MKDYDYENSNALVLAEYEFKRRCSSLNIISNYFNTIAYSYILSQLNSQSVCRFSPGVIYISDFCMYM
jgi:hypothetical protein